MNPASQPPRNTVRWTKRGVVGLTAAFTTYFARQAGNRVTAAERIVNTLLADDPTRNGQHLSEGLYRLVVSPLVVFYEVDSAARVVRITEVGHFRV